MIRLLAVALLLLCSCTRVGESVAINLHVINIGARVLIKMRPLADIRRDCPGVELAARTCWNVDGTVHIELPSDVPQADLVRLALHEVIAHLMPHLGADRAVIDRTLRDLTGDNFQPAACGRQMSP